MTIESSVDEMAAGPSNIQPVLPSTPKLGLEYFNREMCLAPSKRRKKTRVELCATVLPVLESPLSPPDHETGPSIDTPLVQSTNWYIQGSTPSSDPAYITALRREAYENGLNAGSLLFLTPAVSQAAACDGTRIPTTAEGQEIAAGTLPIY